MIDIEITPGNTFHSLQSFRDFLRAKLSPILVEMIRDGSNNGTLVVDNGTIRVSNLSRSDPSNLLNTKGE